MTSTGTLHTFAQHLVLALAPLKEAVADLPAFRTLLYRLGWEATSLPPEYTALATKVDRALIALEGLGDDPTPPQIFTVLDEVKALYDAVNTITTAPQGVDASEFLQEIGRTLFDLLLADYLNEAFPSLHAALLTLNILTQQYVEETDTRPGVLLTRFEWEEVPKLITDPAALPERVYAWGTDDLDFHRLAGHLLEIFVARDWPAYIGRVDEELDRGFRDAPDDATTSIDWGLKIPVLLDNIGGEEIEVGLALLELPPQGGKPAGLILQPLVPAAIGQSFDITDELKLELRAGTDVATTFGVLLRPGDIGVKFPLQQGAALPAAGFGITLRYVPDSPVLLLGTSGKSRLELKGAATSFTLDVRDGQLELRFEVAPEDTKLVVAAAESDGFLEELLNGQDATVPIPLVVQWSSRTGIRFVGGSGFEVSLPGSLRLGPVTLQQIQLALRTTPGQAPDLIVEVGASLGGEIGPVAFSVDNVGLQLASRFTDGNAGPFDIALGFKPPTGVGLVVDAAVVVGGGYLRFEPQKAEYSGILELQMADRIAVKAIGLLVTRLPAGARGYSLLIIITAEDFRPIPLPLGFRLTGVGGLLAINRTFDEEVLRAGLKNHTLDSVLFPQDPIRNASQILSTLNRVFPPTQGHHLFGPMLQLVWGAPTLITADIGIVLELGVRQRVLVLAQVVAVLPKPENELVRLQMDAVGVLDFDQGTAAVDATLYDSRLLKKFVLTGDMALRLKWEGSRTFALAVGGLHPAFDPPPNFPKLERIALDLSSGDNPRLRCEAYFALTANTEQFGARAELYASVSSFSIHGEAGFDVLIQRDPFQFLADFMAQLQLKRGSTSLFKVRVEGELAGPRPLHLKAKATFEIFWWDVTIRVNKTLVAGEPPPRPEPIDVLPRLKEALDHPGNWIGHLPAGQRPLVTLRGKAGAPTDVLLHPLGTLIVKQGVVPLNLDISRFGSAAPAGARRFTISSVSLGGQSPTTDSVTEFFAPAQFFEMSDDEKLSRPSFEPMTAGVRIGSDEFAFTTDVGDWLEVDAIEFETWIIDKHTKETHPSHPEAPTKFYTLRADLLVKQARFGAAGNSDLRRTGRARYRAKTTNKYKVAKEGWRVVAADDLTMRPVPGIEAGASIVYSEAAQALQKLQQTDPAKASGLKILRLSEVATD